MKQLSEIFTESQKLNAAKEKIRTALKSRNLSYGKRIIAPKIIYSKDDVAISSQKWLFNGFIIEYNDLKLCVDPGVDFLSRCSQSEIDLTDINSMFISHAHIDHYASANVISEQIAMGIGWGNALFLLPQNVIDGKVISDYHRGMGIDGKVPQNIILEDGKPISVFSGQLTTVKSMHSIDHSFGFVLDLGDLKVGYTGDTGYATEIEIEGKSLLVSDIKEFLYKEAKIVNKNENMKKVFSQCDVLICNLNSLEYNKHSKTHLTAFDVIDLVKGSKVKQIILAHLNNRPVIETTLNDDISSFIESETGIKTLFLSDQGLDLDLNLGV